MIFPWQKTLNAYYTKGDETLVFVHGISSNISVWNKQIKFFEKLSYGILAVDLPGHGKSIQLRKYCRIHKSGRLLYNTIKKYGIKDPILIGHSLGSIIIQDYIANYGASKVILISSPYGDVLKFSHLKGMHKLIDFANSKVHLHNRPKPIDFKHEKISNMDWVQFVKVGMSMDFDLFVAYMKSLTEVNYSKDMKKFKGKALVISGRHDSLIPLKEQRALANDIKNSQYKILEKDHHNIMFDKHNELNKVIHKFIS